MRPFVKMVLPALVVVLCLFMAGPVSASLLDGTNWSMNLTVKAKVQDVGSVTFQEPYQIVFNPDGTFMATADGGNFFGGTYTVTPDGHISYDVNETEMSEFIAQKIAAVANGEGISLDNLSVDSLMASGSSKAKSKKGWLTYTVKNKFDFVVTATVDGVTETLTGRIMLSGKASQAVAEVDELAGHSFSLDTTEKISVSGVGSDEDQWFLDIHFGPNPAYGLGAGEFLASGGGVPVRGTYVRQGNKGVIEISPDPEDLKLAIEDTIEDAAADNGIAIANVDVYQLVSYRVKGKLRDGLLRIDLKTVFRFSALVDNVPEDMKGKYSIKGWSSGN